MPVYIQCYGTRLFLMYSVFSQLNENWHFYRTCFYCSFLCIFSPAYCLCLLNYNYIFLCFKHPVHFFKCNFRLFKKHIVVTSTAYSYTPSSTGRDSAAPHFCCRLECYVRVSPLLILFNLPEK